MNTLKALFVAGLLSLSSVSFASSITLGDPNGIGSVGTIALTNGDTGVTLGGLFDSTGSAFYEMSIDAGTFASIGLSLDITPPIITLYDVTIAVYETYADLLSGIGSALYTGTNSLSAMLTGGKDYLLQLNGVVDTSYNVDVAAVPVPAAGILFASVLLGAGVFGRRKKKSVTASMVGAFARAS